MDIEGEPMDMSEFTVTEPPKRKGFLNPETLARAQETRAANKAARLENAGEIVSDDDTTEPKKRGRPKGISNKKPRNLAAVEGILVGTHAMLAAALTAPEVSIDATEAHLVAEAVANVADEYKIKLDGKAGAMAGLIYALGIVYGPRAVAIAIRIRTDRKQNNGANQTTR